MGVFELACPRIVKSTGSNLTIGTWVEKKEIQAIFMAPYTGSHRNSCFTDGLSQGNYNLV